MILPEQRFGRQIKGNIECEEQRDHGKTGRHMPHESR